jgi:hypothetical protein
VIVVLGAAKSLLRRLMRTLKQGVLTGEYSPAGEYAPFISRILCL